MVSGFLCAELKGPVVRSQADFQQRDGNVGIEKRLVTWESVDRRFGRAASTMAHSPGCQQEGLGPRHQLPECAHDVAARLSK